MSNDVRLTSLGILDAREFSLVVQRVRHGQEVPLVLLLRSLLLESWLRSFKAHTKLYPGVVSHFSLSPGREHLSSTV
jgi:hypothetical protein